MILFFFGGGGGMGEKVTHVALFKRCSRRHAIKNKYLASDKFSKV